MSGDKGASTGSKGEVAGAGDRPAPVAPAAQPTVPIPPPMQEFTKSDPVGELFKRGG
jgi:hypothetical protein